MGNQQVTAGVTRILLVDDHAIVIEGIAALLSGVPGVEVVGKAADGQAALQLLETIAADVLITDHSMEGMDGLMLVRTVKKLYPHIKVIVLTMHDEPAIVNEVLRAGVDSYILKKYTHSELQMALDVVKEGGQFWSPEVNRILLRRVTPEANVQITEREMEVLKLLVDEMSSREIAEKLFISERTVETHRKNLLRKTNSTNVVGLIKYAHAHALV
ncbi:MAG: response regulator transcription factor [Taibaiella sp.]|nr:response regulator transcription factor [Taibaiella sp.]